MLLDFMMLRTFSIDPSFFTNVPAPTPVRIMLYVYYQFLKSESKSFSVHSRISVRHLVGHSYIKPCTRHPH